MTAALVGSLAFAVLGVVVIVVLYQRGVLPVTGPFVVVVMIPFVATVVRATAVGRVRRKTDGMAKQLWATAQLIVAERALPLQDRTTRASDQSLADAASQVDLALDHLASGRRVDAALTVVQVASNVAISWVPGAALSRRMATAGTAAQRLWSAEQPR